MSTKSKSVTLRVPIAQAGQIETLAAASGLPVSQIILACITRALPYVDGKIAEVLAAQNATPRPTYTEKDNPVG